MAFREPVRTRAVELGDAGVLRPGEWRGLRAIGWMIALTVALVAAYGLVQAAMAFVGSARTGVPPTRPDLMPQAVMVAALLLGSAAVAALYVTLVRRFEKRRVSEFARGRALSELAAGLGVGAAVMLATGAVLWATGWGVFTARPVSAVVKALSIAVQSGTVEEIMFRGVILRLLWRGAGPWWALALSALLFGGLHLGNPDATPFAALCIALEAGVLLAAFYMLTGLLWMSIGVHAGWNFTQGWVLGAAVSGSSGFVGGPLAHAPAQGVSAMLSGGGFGPEASLPALLLCTATGVAVLARARRLGRLANDVPR